MSNNEEIIDKNLIDYLNSKEPLSDDKIEFILNYKSETTLIDNKETFNTDEQREWLNITRDIIAFANTCGGYLVFGIKDKTFEKIGIAEKDWKQLTDPDNIHKKVNAYIQPPLTSLTCKHKIIDNKCFVIVHIPESSGNTHIIVKEGKFRDRSGEDVIRLRKGEIYVRRSGSTQIIEPIDLDGVISRRINYFKDNLLNKIARIVEAPTESEVLIVNADEQEINAGTKRYVLSSGPSAIPVRGLATTVTPVTDESEIATSIALFRKNRSNRPGKNLLYRVYAKRRQLALDNSFLNDLVLMNIYMDIPSYYWLQLLSEKEIDDILNEVFEKGNYFDKVISLKIACCLGEKYFIKYNKKATDQRFEQIRNKFQNYGADELYFQYGMHKFTTTELEKEETELIQKLISSLNENPIVDKTDKERSWTIDYKERLWTIDYKLHAKNIARGNSYD